MNNKKAVVHCLLVLLHVPTSTSDAVYLRGIVKLQSCGCATSYWLLSQSGLTQVKRITKVKLAKTSVGDSVTQLAEVTPAQLGNGAGTRGGPSPSDKRSLTRALAASGRSLHRDKTHKESRADSCSESHTMPNLKNALRGACDFDRVAHL